MNASRTPVASSSWFLLSSMATDQRKGSPGATWGQGIGLLGLIPTPEHFALRIVVLSLNVSQHRTFGASRAEKQEGPG